MGEIVCSRQDVNAMAENSSEKKESGQVQDKEDADVAESHEVKELNDGQVKESIVGSASAVKEEPKNEVENDEPISQEVKQVKVDDNLADNSKDIGDNLSEAEATNVEKPKNVEADAGPVRQPKVDVDKNIASVNEEKETPENAA